MSSQLSYRISEYVDYVNVDTIASDIDIAAVNEAINNMGSELAFRLGATVDALVQSTDPNAAFNYTFGTRLEPAPSGPPLRLVGIAAGAGETVAPAARPVVLKIVTLETKRRFLEE
jgi:hypothetical protein